MEGLYSKPGCDSGLVEWLSLSPPPHRGKGGGVADNEWETSDDTQNGKRKRKEGAVVG